MKSFSLGAIAIAFLLTVGCGVDTGGGENVGETQGEASSSATSKKDKPAAAASDDDMLQGAPAADQSAYAPTEADKVVECMGRDGDSTSVARFSYGTESGIIKSLTVTMNNTLHANDNAVAIAVRGPSDVTYDAAFTSDANLRDGATAAVPLPSDLKVPLGGSIQVLTTFAGGWMGDKTGECRIQL